MNRIAVLIVTFLGALCVVQSHAQKISAMVRTNAVSDATTNLLMVSVHEGTNGSGDTSNPFITRSIDVPDLFTARTAAGDWVFTDQIGFNDDAVLYSDDTDARLLLTDFPATAFFEFIIGDTALFRSLPGFTIGTPTRTNDMRDLWANSIHVTSSNGVTFADNDTNSAAPPSVAIEFLTSRWLKVTDGTNAPGGLTSGGYTNLNTAHIPTNTASMTISTNKLPGAVPNFTPDILYTNVNQRAWVSMHFSIEVTADTDVVGVQLQVDSDGDFTADLTIDEFAVTGVAAGTFSGSVKGFIQPGQVFSFDGSAVGGTLTTSSLRGLWLLQ